MVEVFSGVSGMVSVVDSIIAGFVVSLESSVDSAAVPGIVVPNCSVAAICSVTVPLIAVDVNFDVVDFEVVTVSSVVLSFPIEVVLDSRVVGEGTFVISVDSVVTVDVVCHG